MPTQTGSYDLKAGKQAHDDASKTATNYITEISTTDGIKVHNLNDTSNYAQINSNGMNVVKSGTSVASFGETARIGEENKTHIEMDATSFQMKDKEGNTYAYISDLRDPNNGYIYEALDNFTGTGSQKVFNLSYTAKSTTGMQVTVNDTEITSGITKTTTRITFTTAPAEGDKIVVTYTSSDTKIKAYTFGFRGSGRLGGLSVAEGLNTIASGNFSHAEGAASQATGYASHAEGEGSRAIGGFSHAEGFTSYAYKDYSHAEGSSSEAYGSVSHAEGSNTIARGSASHSEGVLTEANGDYSHAEGVNNIASGRASHAEGQGTEATGNGAHSEGTGTTASGSSSHAGGNNTIAASNNQMAIGKYNVSDANNTYAFIVGIGESDSDRKNGFTVDWEGKVKIQSHASEIGYVNKSSGTKSIATGNSPLKVTDTAVTVTAGTWILIGGIEFPPNATGTRYISWAKDSSMISASRTQVSAATGGFNTRLQSVTIEQVYETTSFNLYCYQNSGSSQSVAFYWQIVRIA